MQFFSFHFKCIWYTSNACIQTHVFLKSKVMVFRAVTAMKIFLHRKWDYGGCLFRLNCRTQCRTMRVAFPEQLVGRGLIKLTANFWQIKSFRRNSWWLDDLHVRMCMWLRVSFIHCFICSTFLRNHFFGRVLFATKERNWHEFQMKICCRDFSSQIHNRIDMAGTPSLCFLLPYNKSVYLFPFEWQRKRNMNTKHLNCVSTFRFLCSV